MAWRLNRLALQRAAYRGASATLLALSIAAAWAARGGGSFRVALAALSVFAVAAAARAAWRVRAGWAGALAAARWVEDRVPLDDRLLTLVSAAPDGGGSRLWPALVADNQAQLPRWGGEHLGIRAVPPDLALLVLALAIAAATLAPWGQPPPEVPRVAAAGKAQPDPAGSSEIVEPKPGGGAVLPGGAPGEGEGTASGRAVAGLASLDGLQAQLGERFERSLAAALVADRGAGRKDDGLQAGADAPERGDPGPSGLGRSKAEPGGVVPDEDLARREQDDGTGQLARRRGAQDGDAQSGRPSGAPGQGGKSAKETEVKAGSPGARPAAPGKGKPEGQAIAADAHGKQPTGTGGAGAGAGKASGPLLAPKALALDGNGRPVAHFSLALGAASGAVGEGKSGEVDAEPQSHIAEGARGAQAAERIVRREDVPADYEAIVKRIFQREP